MNTELTQLAELAEGFGIASHNELAQVLELSPAAMLLRLVGTAPAANEVRLGELAETLANSRKTAGVSAPAIEPSGERFTLEWPGARVLGEGGTSTVHAALDRELNREVAMKLRRELPRQPGQSEVEHQALLRDLDARFVYGACLNAALEHPNIVPVYGMGRREGRPYMVSKLITRNTLRDEIAKRASLEERLELLGALIDAAQGVAFANEKGIIHRDLKSANIFIGDLGEALVGDWASGKVVGWNKLNFKPPVEPPASSFDVRPLGAPGFTQLQARFGTVGYMSPEQARGEPMTARSDVYAMGVMLWEMLSGRIASEEAGEQSGFFALPPLEEIQPDAPVELVSMVRRATQLKSQDRYANGTELLEDLRRAQRGERVGAHPYTIWNDLEDWFAKHRTSLAVGVVALLFLLGGAVVALVVINRWRTQAETSKLEAVQQRQVAVEATQEKEKQLGVAVLERGRSKRFAENLVVEAVPALMNVDGATPGLVAMEKETVPYLESTIDEPNASLEDLRLLASANLQMGLGSERVGHVDNAKAGFVRCARIYGRLVEQGTGNADDRAEAIRCDTGIGDILDEQGDPSGALAQYAAADVLERGTPDKPLPPPSTLESKLGLTHRLSRLAAVHLELKHPDDAERALNRGQELLTGEESTSEPGMRDEVLKRQAVDLMYLGEVAAQRHDPKRALAEFTQALDIDDPRAKRKAAPPRARSDVAVDLTGKGRMELLLGSNREAIADFTRALGLMGALVAKEKSRVEWRLYKSDAEDGLGIALASSNAKASKKLFADEAADAAAMLKQNPSDANGLRLQARAASRLRNPPDLHVE